ncbi:MAG: site-specific integrase [Ilumatobacteraceae bacterium]
MAPRRRTNPTMEAALAAWLATMSSPNTQAAYRRDLQVYVAWTSQAGVAPLRATSVQIDAFRIHCETTGSSPATVHRRMSALSSFFRHATGDGPNPVDGAARPDAPATTTAALTADEAARVWLAAGALGAKTAALVGLIMHDGLKASELLPLDVADVRFGRGTAVVVLDREASVVLTVDPRTGAPLRRYVGARRHGPLFVGDNPTRQPTRLTRFGVDYLVKRAGATAGLPTPLTVNALRRGTPPPH